MTLNATTVPAGSLLLFNASPSPDRVVAVNPVTGNVIASLSTAANYDASGGVYDSVSGHLFLLDRRTSPTKVSEVNPATGAEISSFALPFNASEGGLAINATTGNLWYGSDQSGNVVELTRTGVVVRTLDLTKQGVSANTITGLSFDAAGALYASTTGGLVYKVDTALDTLAQTFATLSGITAVAPDGTPAVAGQASANVGQVITLTGTNFGPGTEVLFDTRDNAGAVVRSNQAPLAINAAGTVLQVLVPNLATTGTVQVVNTGAQNLGFNSYNDAVYRQVSVSFTPAASTSVVRFADLGLQGLSDESWGIDNVRVVQGGATVFSDNFEGGAKANWSNPATDATLPGVFTQFSGRFNGSQSLSLSGLAAGQAVTLTFDLYVLDSWEGTNTSQGPDVFQVSADGTTLLSETFVNYAVNSTTSTQSYGASAGIRLQIVPTLTAAGQPGTDSSFQLTGSGFQEGATTVTAGGVSVVDRFTNQPAFDVSGTRNDTLRVTLPLSLDGPVKVTTDGGSATVAGPSFGVQPPSLFTGIVSAAAAGAVSDATKASANVGQTITLTGQGFTGSTLVQFSGVDDTGVAGAITRTGTAGTNGTSLTVVVPALARTGAVTVLGSGASFVLQVVPVLRGVGGTVAAGNQVVLDGTGLVGTELSVLVDGKAAGTFSVRSVADVNPGYNANPEQGQQLLSLTVPAGVGAGVITVNTAGGSFVLRTGVAVAATASSPAADAGDTIATASTLAVPAGGKLTVSAKTNDGTAAPGKDVDLYKLVLGAGDQVTLGLTGSNYSSLRLFDAAGKQIAAQTFNPSGTAGLVVTVPAAGTYYVGVSGYTNISYDPAVAGSGTASGYTGTYQLQVERLGGGDSRLSSISGTATFGTPARSAVASANVGQTITIAGSGLATAEPVLFSAIDLSGNRYWSQVAAATVVGDGTSLTVVVPLDATTGTVRLLRDPAGLLLQVVPHLTHIDAAAGQGYNGSGLTLTGSGFAEGATSVLFGATVLADSGRSDGLDVTYTYPSYQLNGTITLTTPNDVPTGPIRVATTGGTSDLAGPAFSGITGTAGSGTALSAAQPSANPGQTITITGSGFDTTTDVVFLTIDASGVRSQVLVRPATVNAAGTSATVAVPLQAVTGAVRLVGDQNAASITLQIVPTITGLSVQSVASDGSSATLILSGAGFVEGAATYTMGTTVVPDTSLSQGPDVSASYPNYVVNGTASIVVPLTDGAFGPVVVTTAGGNSAAYTVSLASVTAVAGSGTPADATIASANPGQTVVLNGSGLSTSTSVLFHYTDYGGVARLVSLKPATAAADGTSATLVIPANANGAGKLQVFGSFMQPVLQIVPVVTGYTLSGGTLTLSGAGFAEAGTTYKLPGVAIVDTAAATGPDVQYNNTTGVENGQASVPVTAFGLGTLSVTTAGGTSAGLIANAAALNLGYLRDIGIDQSTGAVWVVDNGSPGKLHKIDPATGAELSSITLTDAGFGSAQVYNGEGLQVVSSAFTLGTTSVPAGSLLLFNASPNPDRVIAVNPATGNVIASLSTAANYDASGGTYDSATGHLFLLDRRTSPTKVSEVNPATGAEISSFALPFNASESGLTINPTTGNLWYGSDQSGNVVELTKKGVVVRTVDLTKQSVPANTITGLAFDSTGALYASTTVGSIVKVTV